MDQGISEVTPLCWLRSDRLHSRCNSQARELARLFKSCIELKSIEGVAYRRQATQGL